MLDEWSSIEEIIAEIEKNGYVVNNLFKIEDRWQCNLRKEGQVCTTFVQERTPREALLASLRLIEGEDDV